MFSAIWNAGEAPNLFGPSPDMWKKIVFSALEAEFGKMDYRCKVVHFDEAANRRGEKVAEKAGFSCGKG